MEGNNSEDSDEEQLNLFEDRRGNIKLETLIYFFIIKKDWVSAKDLLNDSTVQVYMPDIEALYSDSPLNEKCLSMRLLRLHKQGLLDRIRRGHKFLYKLTTKGEDRAVYLNRKLGKGRLET
jgi:hypothetical protein